MRGAIFEDRPRAIGGGCVRLVMRTSIGGVTMSVDMGSFRIGVEIENPAQPGLRQAVRAALVDTGSELSWIPAPILESLGIARRKLTRFRQASGVVVERWTGPAFLYAAGTSTTDEVVFAQPGDLTLLGSRTLDGLNVCVDPITTRLVDAGPAPAAVAA
jgi:predicted aspartyl protease